jgi:hypothetical protein
MATRMQQRRGTASQWTTANPVLAAGEIGFEIDTYKFKIGDGINQWDDIDYFGSTDTLLLELINGAPETLDTLGEIANAIGNNPEFANAMLTHIESTIDVHGIANTLALLTIEHATDTVNVHGISNTLALATINEVENFRTNAIAEAESYTNAQVLAHSLLTENVHGISNTLVLATKNYVANAAGSGLQWNDQTEQFNLDSTIASEEYATNAVADHNALTENVHGIANTLVLATLTDVSNAQNAAEDYADSLAVNYDPAGSAANAEAYADSQIDVHNSETANVHGIANTLALITNAGDQTIDGVLTLSGLIVQGNTTVVNTTDLFIEDPLIYLASNQYDTDLVDIGFTGAYGVEGMDENNHLHNGLVKDVTDGKWKLFSNVPHPVANEIDFDNAVYDTLKVGALEPTVGVTFSDGTQTKEAVPSRTVIHQKTDSYTLSSLDERDDLIEINKSTATTLTIPLDSTLNYPVGTSIDVVQTGSGQVTVAGTSGVTVNGTPGLKLRAQWSSATLFKRAADTWLVLGDLSA